MAGRNQSSKASQNPGRECIKVIFVVSQALVYQRGDCFISAEVCVHAGVCASASMCLCALIPAPRLTTRAKVGQHSIRAAAVAEALQDCSSSHVRTSLHCIGLCCEHTHVRICRMEKGRGGLVDTLAVQHAGIFECVGSLSNSYEWGR